MTVSLHGLDMSWLNDPAKRLPPAPKKRRPNYSNRAENVSIPHFISDIEPFVSIATRDTVEITSRSQLRAYERANNIRQCGDLKGKVIPEQKKRIEAETYISEADKQSVDFKWVD